jgi:hypothetical protein
MKTFTSFTLLMGERGVLKGQQGGTDRNQKDSNTLYLLHWWKGGCYFSIKLKKIKFLRSM